MSEVWNETIDELCVSLIGCIIPNGKDDNIERWREWMCIYPDEKPVSMHTDLLRRKKYHFRCVFDFALLLEVSEEDSPVKEILEINKQQALCELRRVDAEIMAWDFLNGIVALTPGYDSAKLYLLAQCFYSTQEWIYDSLRDLAGKAGKRKSPGSKMDVLGIKPHINQSTKDFLVRILHGHKFIGRFANRGIGELISHHGEVSSTFWKGWIQRIGLIVKLHNELFRVM